MPPSPATLATDLLVRAKRGGRAALFFAGKDGAVAHVWADRSSKEATLAIEISRADGTAFEYIWFDAKGDCHPEPLSDQRGMLARLEALCRENTVRADPQI